MNHKRMLLSLFSIILLVFVSVAVTATCGTVDVIFNRGGAQWSASGYPSEVKALLAAKESIRSKYGDWMQQKDPEALQVADALCKLQEPYCTVITPSKIMKQVDYTNFFSVLDPAYAGTYMSQESITRLLYNVVEQDMTQSTVNTFSATQKSNGNWEYTVNPSFAYIGEFNCVVGSDPDEY